MSAQDDGLPQGALAYGGSPHHATGGCQVGWQGKSGITRHREYLESQGRGEWHGRIGEGSCFAGAAWRLPLPTVAVACALSGA